MKGRARASIVWPSAAAVLGVLSLASGAWSHAFIESSSPADGMTLMESPREVTLVFSESIELVFSRVAVRDARGAEVHDGALRQPSAKTLVIGLRPLAAGRYTVEWRVLSVDTHVTEGRFGFVVVREG
jgi:methionine-rich copper-binding protein CopC